MSGTTATTTDWGSEDMARPWQANDLPGSAQASGESSGIRTPHPELSVLIVGAGPTGLLLAGELARHGVTCRLIDEAGSRRSAPRAINLHARTLEVLDDLGLTGDLLALGRPVHGVNVSSAPEPLTPTGARRLVHLSLDVLDTPYPFILSLPQTDTERVLEGFAERCGVRVERSVRLTGLAQDAEGVTARLEHLERGRVESVRCTWLVGCDGEQSTVRRALNLPFTGAHYAEVFALADVRLAWERPDDQAQVFVSPQGILMFMPLPGDGRWRIVADLSPLPGGQSKPEPTLDRFQTLVEQRGAGDARLLEGTWMSHFRIHRRIVPHYRVGRVFLAGDAAHVHSPIGAQGMNIGLQDADNLAWKLALVIHGASRPEVLGSYDAERRPIAKQVLRNTDLGTRLVTLRNPLGREIRDRLASLLLGLNLVQQRIARTFSEIAVTYRGSPLVAEDWRSPLGLLAGTKPGTEPPGLGGWLAFWRGPVPGERAPDVEFGPPGQRRRLFDVLRGTRHVLLLFDSTESTAEGYANLGQIAREVEAGHGAEVAVHLVVPHAGVPDGLDWTGSVLLDPDWTLHTRWGASAECLYLVRPDGYVGYRAQPADRALLTAYLDRIFT